MAKSSQNDPYALDTAMAPGTITFAAIPQDGRVLFFSRDRAAFGFLSHFHPARLVIDSVDWPTVEHFYQAQKSLDPRYFAAIRACETPNAAKRLASFPQLGQRDRGSWFLAHGKSPRPDWFEIKRDLMRRGDTAKYAQNLDLARRLLATDHAEIIEDAKHDVFWGVGRDGEGQNWAGRIIMEVRDTLSAQVESGDLALD